MTDADKLRRLADLSAEIARRLCVVRTWSAEDKAQHRQDIAERDALLAAASPSYLPNLAHYRATANDRTVSPWRLRMAGLAVRVLL